MRERRSYHGPRLFRPCSTRFRTEGGYSHASTYRLRAGRLPVQVICAYTRAGQLPLALGVWSRLRDAQMKVIVGWPRVMHAE
jgi:hypothetical protein